MTSKAREKAILNMIYEDNQFAEIATGEAPDFQLTNKGEASTFGVEITEFYHSQSTARVRNIPRYVTEVVDQGRYRHKEDMIALPVCEATLVRAGEPDRRIEGLFYEAPDVAQYVHRVAEVLREKNKQLGQYAGGLTHVNLIIFDTETRLSRVRAGQFYACFFTPGLKAALSRSGYREVYFITKLDADRWVYIPLNLMLLLSEVYLFDYVLVTYYASLCASPTQELYLFAQYLKRKTTREIYIRQAEIGTEVIYGGYGVTLSQHKDLTVKDYADYQVPQDSYLLRLEPVAPFDTTFDSRVSESCEHNVFVSELAFNVKSDVSLIWAAAEERTQSA
jgi:hypothetical protein